jgi:ornithine cyclodeaminase|tara:strand:- start:193 stop:1140 length:948 start_codon:yes stop_codon:yes gene_type:complete
MQFIDTQTVANMLPYGQLIEALRIAFKEQICSPERTQYKIETNEVSDATLLLMPAWKKSQHIGIKVVSVFPENTKSSLSAVNASYLLLDAKNGLPKVIMDGTELTLRRTACASALAADYLTRDDVSSMLMVGTGNLAPHLIEAHMQLRDIRKVMIWGRDYQKALILAKKLKYKGVEISAINDLYEGVQMADIVSCATLSNTPLILGEWLKKGQHIDLVGAFTPEMHEVDSQALKMANVIVDTYAGALSESGELIDAIKEGLFFEKDIIAEMSEIVKQQKIGRNNKNEITLFKSVGAALEDLAAAELVLTNLSETI